MISTLRVQVLAHHRERVLELDEPAQRQVLGLHRDDHAGRGDERVDGQEPERRRRVDEDVVVAILDRRKRLLERALAADLARERQSAPARSIDATAMSTSRFSITCSIGSRWTSTSNIERSIGRGSALGHRQVACGSRSMRQRARPARAKATPEISVVVVWATPPFWFASAITCVCEDTLSLFRVGERSGGRGGARAMWNSLDSRCIDLFLHAVDHPRITCRRRFPTAPPLPVRASSSAARRRTGVTSPSISASLGLATNSQKLPAQAAAGTPAQCRRLAEELLRLAAVDDGSVNGPRPATTPCSKLSSWAGQAMR